MILINLLPHREAARKRRRELFFATLGLAALVGGLIAGAIFLWHQAKIGNQESRNSFLTAEIRKLDDQIKEIKDLQSEINALKARQQAVEDLQADRNLPVHLLNELAAQMPEGVFITRVSQRGPTAIDFGGSAQSDERVNELLRNLTYGSEWIGSPELIEIVSSQLSVGPGSAAAQATANRRNSNFSMRAQLKRPAAIAAPAPAGSSALPAAPQAVSAKAAGSDPAKK